MDIRLPEDPQFNKYYTKHCKYLVTIQRKKTKSSKKDLTWFFWENLKFNLA